MTKKTTIDHIAIVVTDIAQAIRWYQNVFEVSVVYQDTTWALLAFDNIHVAFVLPEQHPAHIAIKHPHAATYGPLKQHRDHTQSVYIQDPFKNIIELVQS